MTTIVLKDGIIYADKGSLGALTCDDDDILVTDYRTMKKIQTFRKGKEGIVFSGETARSKKEYRKDMRKMLARLKARKKTIPYSAGCGGFFWVDGVVWSFSVIADHKVLYYKCDKKSRITHGSGTRTAMAFMAACDYDKRKFKPDELFDCLNIANCIVSKEYEEVKVIC